MLSKDSLTPLSENSNTPPHESSQVHRIISDWNSTTTPYPHEKLIHQLFEEQVDRTPEATAVVESWGSPARRSMTYLELNQRSNQLAHFLRSVGVGPESIVGVHFERSQELVIAVLAILKAGGAFLALDPDYPVKRLEFMLSDSQTHLVLTQQSLLGKLDFESGQVISLQSHWDIISQESTENPVNSTAPLNPAFLIYTSGSTGNPKGAINTHQSLCNHVHWLQSAFPLSSEDRILLKGPLGFDTFEWELCAGLLWGAQLIIIASKHTRDVGKILQAVAEYHVTMLLLVPSFGRVMLEDTRFKICGQLRWLFFGGEALPPELVQRVRNLIDVEIINIYGPAEACIDTVCYPVPEGANISVIPIGKPFDNNRAYILDDRLNLLPIGETGELYLAGDSLGRGYIHQPALTAERFLPDPFSPQGGRLYRTGDLTRYLPDGNIEFLGRVDFQVKIRGSRLELGEIESCLHRHLAIQQAAVVMQDETHSGKAIKEPRLVAYLVIRHNNVLTIRELRRYLSEKLPDYMIPAVFFFLDAIPVSSSGKIDRLALMQMNAPAQEREREFIPPVTSTQKVLADIWSQVLGESSIGINDSFFELGGHSLALAQVQTRVYEHFQVELPITDIFSVPVISQMAEQVEGKMQSGGQLNYPPLLHLADRENLPLSYAQEQVWFLHNLQPENLAYNYQITIRLRGMLNLQALTWAFDEIIRRHEIYRTTFHTHDGSPIQVIHPPWKVEIPLIDLSQIPGEMQIVQQEELLEEFFSESLEITRIPLIKWRLLKFSELEHLLVHYEHHLVHDGWSFAVLMQEFQALYQAYIENKPSPLPNLPFQFSDYAVWQRQVFQGRFLESQLGYWRERLKGVNTALPIPTDHPRPPRKSFRGAAIQVDLGEEFYRKVKSFSLKHGVTLFTTFLTAFKVLLLRYTGQEDILIGSGFANRRLREFESLIGMFVNTVLLRTDLSGELSFQQSLERVRHTILEASAHQDMPFEKLVQMLQPERNPSYNPYFQVLFSFHDSPVPELEFPGLHGSMEYRQNKAAKFDLNIVVIPRAEQLIGSHAASKNRDITLVWEYDTDLFEENTMRRMIDHYLRIISAMIDDPTQKITQVKFIGEQEQILLLDRWNDTFAEIPSESCIHEIFEKQVKQDPDATAILEPGRFSSTNTGTSTLPLSITYQHLDRLANQIARKLQRHGVSAGDIVGVCMDRSVNSVVSFLAIVKAGGAYLPLDVSHPVERLDFMIADSGAKAILSQEKYLGILDNVEAPIICLDSDRAQIEQESHHSLPVQNTPQDLAYVMYTSGSTGKPKGIGIPHLAVSRLVLNNNYLQVRRGDRMAQVTNTSFDLNTFEVWGTLLNGGTLVIISQSVLLNPNEFSEMMKTERIDVLCIATALFNHIASFVPQAFRAIREVIFGGEAASPEILRQVQRAGGPKRLINGYGPTENTTWTTCYEIGQIGSSPWNVPIGEPVSNTQVYVLDRWLNLAPIGVAGELFNAGKGLAQGYHNRPTLTAEKFIPNPFGAPGERMYRTGDLARYLPDGILEFLGRIDQQVKLRGFRVELGEIEAALEDHPAIRRAAVIIREDSPGNKRLVGYVVFRSGQSVQAKELREFLSKRLPGYMVPNPIFFIPSMPITPNGKVDRRALPKPSATVDNQALDWIGEPSALEKVLTQIWSEILGTPVNDLHTSFFDLGGHSLLAIRINNRLIELFGIQINPRLLFEQPNVAGFAAAILEQSPDRDKIEKTAQLLLELEDLPDDQVVDELHRISTDDSKQS